MMKAPTLRQQVDRAIDPYYRQAADKLKSYFATSGLGIGTSTAGARAMADLDRQIAEQKSNLLEQLRLQRRQDERAEKQLAMQKQFGLSDRATRLFELLASLGLQEWSLSNDPKKLYARLPKQAPFFTDYSRLDFKFPKVVTGYEKGDWPTRNVRMGESPASIEARKAQANIDYMNALRSSVGAGGAEEQTDLWPAITEIASNTELYPSERYRQILGATGIDVIAEARAGNPNARAVLGLLWPNTADEILRGYTPLSLGGYGPRKPDTTERDPWGFWGAIGSKKPSLVQWLRNEAIPKAESYPEPWDDILGFFDFDSYPRFKDRR